MLSVQVYPYSLSSSSIRDLLYSRSRGRGAVYKPRTNEIHIAREQRACKPRPYHAIVRCQSKHTSEGCVPIVNKALQPEALLRDLLCMFPQASGLYGIDQQ